MIWNRFHCEKEKKENLFQLGDQRKMSGFLWLPMELDFLWCWLRKEYWLEVYRECVDPFAGICYRWKPVTWISKERYNTTEDFSREDGLWHGIDGRRR